MVQAVEPAIECGPAGQQETVELPLNRHEGVQGVFSFGHSGLVRYQNGEQTLSPNASDRLGSIWIQGEIVRSRG
jgi:hypothetical protein